VEHMISFSKPMLEWMIGQDKELKKSLSKWKHIF
jgi:hypothetical protein